MKARELGRHRLMSLHVAASHCSNAAEVVSSLGAMQAQDYAGALWAIGLRLPGAVLADVERAVAERSIVRTWPMRGTLHFVASRDVGFMLDLLAPRVFAASSKRREELELDAQTLHKVEQHLVRALEGGRKLTRDAIRDLLEQAKISTAGGRLYHMLFCLSLQQVLCFGTPEGKQPTFALLREWVPTPRRLDREAALCELATRYFTSHGPARTQDLMRWAALSAAEVKLGIAASDGLASESIDGTTYWMARERAALSAKARGTFLLPGFDEYILGYGERSAILAAEHAHKIVPGANGVFRPTIVHDGLVVGTWKAAATKKSVRLTASGFTTLSEAQHTSFAGAGARYAAFLGRNAAIA